MEFAFVSSVGVGISSSSTRLAVSNKSNRATMPRRSGTVRMMAADSSGENKSLGEWFLDKFMHNFGNDYGYETYFKPAEKAREEEVKRVRGEVDNSKDE